MLNSLMVDRTFNPHARGFFAVYRAGEINLCPACGRSQWLVGRILAECAFCSTAVPLDASRCAASNRVPVSRSSPPGERLAADLSDAGEDGERGFGPALNRGEGGGVRGLPPARRLPPRINQE